MAPRCPRMLALALIVAVFAATATAVVPECGYNGLNFSSLTSDKDLEFIDASTSQKYFANICGTANKPGNCQSDHGMICQEDQDDYQYTLGVWGDVSTAAKPSPVWVPEGELPAHLLMQNAPEDCYIPGTVRPLLPLPHFGIAP